ncbi:hypothetical protein ABWH92_12375 [Ahrensia marina]|uniref:hypothetical protein n=1 Tax=Ahrensia marina TaxID=1514904 RepID=UPI0035CFA6ED
MPTLIFIVGLLIFGFFYIREIRAKKIGYTRKTLRGFKDFGVFGLYFYGAIAALFVMALVAWLLAGNIAGP